MSILYSKYTEDFVRSALDFCVLAEKTGQTDKTTFVNNMVRVLPLLYLKASIIPPIKEDNGSELEQRVSEAMYERVRDAVSAILGDDDLYLETFHPDIKMSDSPVAVRISEDLADIYQDLGNFIAEFKNGQTETMNDSLALCIRNFEKYWGQRLVNSLRALHNLKYREWEEA
ncbi:MAG: DUF5063 domain-containing protein [Dysgonamonadaceae bacterium]|jgi:hypothetical protein|nr:DUF5063 domain-containing protein [Dysgonamonadaceae bacterium]